MRELRALYEAADADGTPRIYTVGDDETCRALQVRLARFEGAIRVEEQEQLRAWGA